jgi:hypothetical protein
MTVDDKIARLAGLLYLIMLPTVGGWYGFSSSLLAGNATDTIANIQANRTLFQAFIVVGAIGFVDFLLLAMVFRRLLSPVGKDLADVLLAFVAVSVPISLVAITRQMDILTLLDGTLGLPVLDDAQLQAQVILALQSYTNLFQLSAIFWGLWLIPLGWLVFRSGFLPRTLGVLLMIGSLFYILTFVGTVFDPDYVNSVLGRVVGIVSGVPGIIGELGTILWLLIKGSRWRGRTNRSQEENA